MQLEEGILIFNHSLSMVEQAWPCQTKSGSLRGFPRTTKGSTGHSGQVWARLGVPGQIEPKLVNPDATFTTWLPSC